MQQKNDEQALIRMALVSQLLWLRRVFISMKYNSSVGDRLFSFMQKYTDSSNIIATA